MLNYPASIIYSQCLSIDSNNVVINKRSPHGFNSRKPHLYGALRYLPPVFIDSRHVSRFGAVLFLVCSQDEVVTSLNEILRLFFLFFFFFFFPGGRGAFAVHMLDNLSSISYCI